MGRLISLDLNHSIWERFYTVSPLLLVGTVDPDGAPDLAPKHMAFPLGWDNYFGFVCAPSHGTCKNIARTGGFAVSYPRPSQIVQTSLAASPRGEEGKPILGLFDTVPAKHVEGFLLQDAYAHLECRHLKTIDGFGPNVLICGEIVSASVDEACLRDAELDDGDRVVDAPMLAYLYPDRFAAITETRRFPMPAGMRK